MKGEARLGYLKFHPLLVPLGLGDPKRTLEPRPFNKTRSLAVSLSRVTMGHHGSPVVLPSGVRTELKTA